MLAALLAVGFALTPADAVRQAVVRAIATDWGKAAPFLCVDIATPPADRGTKFWHISLVGADPPQAVLGERAIGGPIVAPRSACSIGQDYDGPIVLKRLSRPGGVTVSIGPVQFPKPDDARVVVLTWAGGLSHTFSEWKVRLKAGTWQAEGSTILLQE